MNFEVIVIFLCRLAWVTFIFSLELVKIFIVYLAVLYNLFWDMVEITRKNYHPKERQKQMGKEQKGLRRDDTHEQETENTDESQPDNTKESVNMDEREPGNTGEKPDDNVIFQIIGVFTFEIVQLMVWIIFKIMWIYVKSIAFIMKVALILMIWVTGAMVNRIYHSVITRIIENGPDAEVEQNFVEKLTKEEENPTSMKCAEASPLYWWSRTNRSTLLVEQEYKRRQPEETTLKVGVNLPWWSCKKICCRNTSGCGKEATRDQNSRKPTETPCE